MSDFARCVTSAAEAVWIASGVSTTPRSVYAEIIARETGLPELIAALKAARFAMTNIRYDKPRIGMEAECQIVDDALRKAGAL